MKAFYNIKTKRIFNIVPDIQTMESYYFHHGKEFLKNMREIYLNIIPSDWQNYKVIDNELIRMTKQEIQEIKQYGRLLSEEERLLNQLKPSSEEIQKAQNTIEILTLIQEVM